MYHHALIFKTIHNPLGRYDCAAMGDDAGMGNDEKGCYVFEYSNGFLFIVCALSFIIRDGQDP